MSGKAYCCKDVFEVNFVMNCALFSKKKRRRQEAKEKQKAMGSRAASNPRLKALPTALPSVG